MSDASLKCASCGKSESESTGRLLRCGRCKQAPYCSKACQKTAWSIHKVTCVPNIPAFSGSPNVPADRGKQVLLLELEDYSWLGDLFNDFHAKMRQSCRYDKITKLDTAICEVGDNPNAVIVFEPSIMNEKKHIKYQTLNQTLVAYVKSGGILVFGCQCSSNVRPSDLDWYFKAVWDLPWKMGNYARYQFQTNPNAATILGKTVPSDYNVKAVQLNNVEESAVVYWQAGEMHSLTGLLPTPANHGSKSGPVVWQKYENGWVGWTGDVNNEEETRVITRMMCDI